LLYKENILILIIVTVIIKTESHLKVDKPQRRSHQRDIIESELKKVTSHPTAAELYQIVREILPKVSLGTVYRNLEQLTQDGSIRKLTNGASVRYDGNTEFHNHVRCTLCEAVADVRELPDELLSINQEMLTGYKIIGCNVEFLGVCPACQFKDDKTDSISS
jgi:Fur family ferric uptake transcriptional regulator